MDTTTTIAKEPQGMVSRRRLLAMGAITGTGLVAGALAACTTPVSGGWGLEPSSVAATRPPGRAPRPRSPPRAPPPRRPPPAA